MAFRKLDDPLPATLDTIEVCDYCKKDFGEFLQFPDGTWYVVDAITFYYITRHQPLFDETGPFTVKLCSAVCIVAYLADAKWMGK